jgi:putative transposase
MRRIGELHMDFPFAGSRMLRDLLVADGVNVGRLHLSIRVPTTVFDLQPV